MTSNEPVKPPIPELPRAAPDTWNFNSAMKTNMELLTGVRGGTLDTLKSSASQADVIKAVNAIIARLNHK